MKSIALLSLHGCPVARLGERDTGGMNVYLLQIARELGQAGIRVDVFTRSHDPADPQIIELGPNARVIHIRAGGFEERKENLYAVIPEFLANLDAFKRDDGVSYEIVHSHYWLSGRAGIELSRKWGVPHVATFHTLARLKMQARLGEHESSLRVETEGAVMESVDGVVVSTDAEATEISRLYDVSLSRVEVIAPGVDLELFKPTDMQPARDKLNIEEKNVVLYVGRLEPLKGVDILVKAVADLEMVGSTRLLIVGGDMKADPLAGRLGRLAGSLGIAEKVTFTGPVPHSDLPTYYGAADVLCLPSHYESFGLVALEAMACGTPVVVSRVGGLKTFVRNGESGYLIPWRCPDPFSQQIEVILANPSLRRAMGSAALETARRMGWGGVSSRLIEFYEKLIDSPAAPPNPHAGAAPA
jgi:D-inositol-3-phosphate glycosyltransferase